MKMTHWGQSELIKIAPLLFYRTKADDFVQYDFHKCNYSLLPLIYFFKSWERFAALISAF